MRVFCENSQRSLRILILSFCLPTRRTRGSSASVKMRGATSVSFNAILSKHSSCWGRRQLCWIPSLNDSLAPLQCAISLCATKKMVMPSLDLLFSASSGAFLPSSFMVKDCSIFPLVHIIRKFTVSKFGTVTLSSLTRGINTKRGCCNFFWERTD